MKEVEMFVKLLMPDTTAITTFHTLENMGFKSLKKLERLDYYKFSVEDNVNLEEFKNKISKVDVLVNANKHKASFVLPEAKNDMFKVVTQSIENDAEGLLGVLRNRLNFKDVAKMEKGVLWVFTIKNDSKEESSKKAEEMTKSLLINRHYQKYRMV